MSHSPSLSPSRSLTKPRCTFHSNALTESSIGCLPWLMSCTCCTLTLSFAQTHCTTPAYVSISLWCTCGSWSLDFLVAVAAILGIWSRNIHLSAAHLKIEVPKEGCHNDIYSVGNFWGSPKKVSVYSSQKNNYKEPSGQWKDSMDVEGNFFFFKV